MYEECTIKSFKKNENMLSMMLETEAESGNYEMTTRDSWPTSGYKFNSILSKCENGGEISWDDENKRVLMSGNASDKCYVYFDLIVKTQININDTLLEIEILEKRGAQGTLCGMDADFVAHVYELIHGESVRQQIEIVNKN